MGARQKLNASYGTGSLLVAGIIGGLFGSWPVFFVALAAMLALNLFAGEIRPGGDRRPGRFSRPHSRKEQRHEEG